MFGDGNDILRTGSFEELRPFSGVEMLGAKLWDQIFVTLRIIAVRELLFEILVGAVFLVVHVAGIPLILGRRNGVDAPVDEDAEFRVLVPLRLLILDERGPIGTIGTVVRLAVGFGQKAIAFRVVLADRLLPFAVDLLGGLHVLCGRERIGSWRGRLSKEKWEGNGKNCRQKKIADFHTRES